MLLSLLALQRFDEARQTIQQLQPRRRADLVLQNAVYALAFLRSDSQVMAEQQKCFADKLQEENSGLSLASDPEAYAGHLSKTRELTKRACRFRRPRRQQRDRGRVARDFRAA